MTARRPETGSSSAAAHQQADFSTDITRLLARTHGRDQLIIKLLHATGITPQELVELKTKDHERHTATLILRPETTKNGQARKIPLSTHLSAALATHAKGKRPDEHLFTTRQSPKLTTRRVEQLLENASEDSPITSRTLRNAYIEHAAKAAKNTAQLRTLTGLAAITKPRTLTTPERARLYNTLEKRPLREQALISIILDTGARLAETLQLTTGDLKGRKLRLPGRTVTLNTTLTKLLHRQAPGPFFPTRQSTQLTTRRAEQLISELGREAGIADLTPNLLRATAIATIQKHRGAAEAAYRAGCKSGGEQP